MSKLLKVRVNDKYIGEFEEKIRGVDKKDYTIKSVKKIEENKISEEFSDWLYEYKNSSVGYYNYPIYEFKLNDSVKKVLGDLFGKNISSKSLWYKKDEIKEDLNPDVKDEKGLYQNRFTIYVITKGRWDTNYTIKSLETLGIKNYKVVIETDEVEKYISSGVDKEKIIPFEKEDKENKSGIPVRNFVWNYSKGLGEEYHWILDDNIKDFYRWNRNKRTKVKSGFVFTHIEDYTQKKNNVMLAGMNYFCFNNDIDYRRDIIMKNTRIYSCILIKNDIPHLEEQWRGLFNEDTDLSLRVLKLGYGTMLFNNYLCGKQQTGKIKGGNQELYKNYTQEGYKKKTQSLIDQHPTLVKESSKFGKECHHQVDYRPFKQNPLSVRYDYERLFYLY